MTAWLKTLSVYLGSALSLVGCAPVVFESELNTPPRHLVEKRPDEVHIFYRDRPTRPFVEIAVLRASENLFHDRSPLVAVQEAAALRGCDGLIIAFQKKLEYHGSTKKPHEREEIEGTCIAYTDRH
jgi:hypothetical protein